MGLVARLLVVCAALVALATPVSAHEAAGRSRSPFPGPTAVPARSVRPMAAPVHVAKTRACAAGLIALTFDDGPQRGTTRQLVRLLLDRHVPATFFMVGERVRRSPRLARMVARAGFTVGNHTWSHPQLTRLADRAVRREIRSTARELRRGGVPASTLMRPPYGLIDARVRADVRGLGLVPVLWNVDSNDWRGGTARQIADSILRQLHRHHDHIVLQHDGIPNSPASIAAVPRVVHQARRRGYCFGRLGPRGHVLPPRELADDGARVALVPTGRAHPVVATPFGQVLDRTT